MNPERGGDLLTRVIDTMRRREKDVGAYVVDQRIIEAFSELKAALIARGFEIEDEV